MQESHEKRRIEMAWSHVREWFGAGGGGLQEEIYLLLPGFGAGGIARAFRRLAAESTRHLENSVWRSPEVFDPGGGSMEEMIERLEAGDVLVYSFNYEIEVGTVTLQALLDVTTDDIFGDDAAMSETGGFFATVYTRHGYFSPASAATGERFDAWLRHGLALEGLLGASGLYVGPERDDVPEVEGTTWVRV